MLKRTNKTKKRRKIVLVGGTGFLGSLLTEYLLHNGDMLVVIARKRKPNPKFLSILWDGQTLGNWVQHINGADVLINLAGKSVDCRYTKRNKNKILKSRVHSTALLAKAVALCQPPPPLWMNASSATIYSESFGAAHTENSPILASNFSEQVCAQWETAFYENQIPGVRYVALRLAIVLNNNGGPFPVYKKLVRFGLGGTQGKGNQFFSWLHSTDFCRIVQFVMDHDTCQGNFNCAAPNALKNREWMQLLRHINGIKFGLNLPKWLLEIAAFVLRTETELLLKSRRVVPKKLTSNGFKFVFNSLDEIRF